MDDFHQNTTHCTQLNYREFLHPFKKSCDPNWTFPSFRSIFLFSFVLSLHPSPHSLHARYTLSPFLLHSFLFSYRPSPFPSTLLLLPSPSLCPPLTYSSTFHPHQFLFSSTFRYTIRSLAPLPVVTSSLSAELHERQGISYFEG